MNSVVSTLDTCQYLKQDPFIATRNCVTSDFTLVTSEFDDFSVLKEWIWHEWMIKINYLDEREWLVKRDIDTKKPKINGT